MSANRTAITCHWIDKDFQLHEALLEFKKLNGRHTERMLAEEVYRVLYDFGIAPKLFCITCDNASNNKKMMKELKWKLLRDELSWTHEEHHIACLNHVINLAVEAFLKSINIVDINKNDQVDQEDNGDDDQNDETDENDDENESDNDMNVEVKDNSVLTTEFKTTMKKIRKIIKVEITIVNNKLIIDY